MRIGEVCGLRWCDVDFETGLISIRHSVAYAKGMGSFIKDAMATLNVYADIEPISKIHNMLRVSPCLWRGYLGPRVDPGPMFQQRIQESIETLQAFGYGVTEPDDRNIVIRDVKTISRLYPTEYAAVLGPSQLRSRWSDRGAARGMRRGAVSPTE